MTYLLFQDNWRGTPATPSLGVRLQNLRLARGSAHVAAPILFVFVLIATCTMLSQDLTPGLAPSQHPCMQPHFTYTSSPPTSLHPTAISILAIKLPVRNVALGLASVFDKDRATLHTHHSS